MQGGDHRVSEGLIYARFLVAASMPFLLWVWLVAARLCCHVVACVYYDDLANTTQARFTAISTIANSW